MAQVINTNIASLNAQRNLNSSQAGTNQALERLSSGLRINSAKDDAAGLAISTRFESQIKGLNVAIRNAGDGVSLAQTAEGSLGSMTESLQRIRELALQAANGTNSSADRQALNAEAQLLIEEVGRVSSGANFNGVNLLDGSLATTFQVGANAGESIGISIGKLTTDTLGVSAANGVSATGSSNALSNGDLVINGVTVGASRASDDTASTANAAASAISKAAAINRVSDQSGVTAVVDANVAAGTKMEASAETGTVTVNGTTINLSTTGDAASSRASVVSAINAQSSLTGVTAVDSGDDALGVSLVAADGRNISLSYGGDLSATNTGLAAAGTNTGGVTLVASSGTNQVSIAGANTANAGVSAGTYTAGVSTVSSSARYADSQSPAIIAGTESIAGLAATNFGQLANIGQGSNATVTSVNLSAADLDFAAVATGAAFTGNDVTAYAFDQAPAGGTPAVTLGDAVVEFSFAPISFSIDQGDSSIDITLGSGPYADVAAIAAEIQGQTAGRYTVADVGGALQFTEVPDAVTGSAGGNITISGDAAGLEALGLDATTATTPGVASTTQQLSFDVVVDGVSTRLTITDAVTDAATALTAVDNAATAAGLVDVDITLDGDKLVFTNTSTTGASSTIQLSNFSGDDVAGGAAALGLPAFGATANGLDATNTAITVSNGSSQATIELTADYSGAGGDTALQTYLNDSLTALGLAATVTDNAGVISIEIAEVDRDGATITVTNGNTTPGGVNGATTLFGGPVSDTGIREFATDQNLEFTVGDGENSVAVNINTAVADAEGLVAAINAQLDGNVNVRASLNNSGNLALVSTVSGAAAEVEVNGTNANSQTVIGLVDGPAVNGSDSVFGADALNEGDLVINGVSIGAARASDDTASFAGATSSIKEASGISMAAAINRATDSTGVAATVNATQVVGGASTPGVAGNTGTLNLNGIEVTLTVQSSADANRASAVSQINAASGQTGVVAEDNGSGVTLTAADGRNIVLAFDTDGGASAANFGLASDNMAEVDLGATGQTANDVAVTTYSTVSLSSAGTIDVKGGTSGNAGLEGLGLSQGSFGGAVSGQFLNEVDISTQKGATAALAAIDNALNAVNSARADLGAVQNRFEATISNLAINSENLSAANSRIRDADFAAEAANLARSQVLQQAGISILSQANASGQQVLALLQ